MPPLPQRLSSIRAKLTLTIVAIAVVAVAALTLLATCRASSEAESSAEELLHETAERHAQQTAAEVGADWAVARSLAASVEKIGPGEDDRFVRDMKTLAERNPQLIGVYAGWEPGAFPGTFDAVTNNVDGRVGAWWIRDGDKLTLDGLMTAPISDDDPEDEWYTVIRGRNEDTVTEPYYDSVAKKVMTSYLSPIQHDGEFAGMAGVDVGLSDLTAKTAKVKVLESGEGLLVTGSGMVIGSRQSKIVGKQTLAQLAKKAPELRQVAAAVKAGKGGQIEGKNPFTGADSFISWAPVEGPGWSFLAFAPRDEVLAEAHGTRTDLLLLGLLALLVIAGATAVVASRISKPIVAVAEAADRIADGDLDVQLDTRSTDETGRMARAFERMTASLRDTASAADEIADGNLDVEVRTRSEHDVLGAAIGRMTQQLRSLIGELGTAAGTLHGSSRDMAATSTESGRAVEQIAGAIGDIASGAERQAQSVEQLRAMAEELSTITSHNTEGAAGTRAAAEQASEIARDGAHVVDEAAAAMRQLREASEETVAAIRALGDKSQTITGMVDTITEIADQTNLLALNAAIEAARAGEQGRGFAVVAEEVRKLADDSRSAAANIATLAGDIQTDTARVVGVVEDSTERTAHGADVVERAGAAFGEIGHATDDVTGRALQMGDAARAVAALAERMQAEIDAVALVVESASATTEQVAASAQETSASSQEIASSAQHLAEHADSLSALVGRFRVTR